MERVAPRDWGMYVGIYVRRDGHAVVVWMENVGFGCAKQRRVVKKLDQVPGSE